MLIYSVGALELSQSSICELGVCWNDAFRKIFSYHRWESVKLLQYYFGSLDFRHYYVIQRWRLLNCIENKLKYVDKFCVASEFELHTCRELMHTYAKNLGTEKVNFTSVVYEHFASLL